MITVYHQTYVTCDICKNGFQWINHYVSKTRATAIAKTKGWKMGKKHVCPECQGVNKK